MSEPIEQPRQPRWFQFSLRTLLVLMVLVGTYFAGFATSQKLAEKAMREARDKAAEEAALLAEQQRAAAQMSFFVGFSR